MKHWMWRMFRPLRPRQRDFAKLATESRSLRFPKLNGGVAHDLARPMRSFIAGSLSMRSNISRMA